MRIVIDKIASATANVPLRREARISPDIIAREGSIIAGRIRGSKNVYNQLEDVHGRMVPLHDGDAIAGVLGQRNALHGYSGYVPEKVQVGDRLHVLNLGGVVGICTSENPDLGKPFELEVLGSVLVFPEFEDREGIPAHIGMNALAAQSPPLPDVPVVFIAGTCMNSGKTSAASALIRQLARKDFRVGGCKLTGVSLRRDTLQMRDHGAAWAVSFNDAGIVSTTPETSVHAAHTLLAHLGQLGADVIVAELGDGILGEYGVAQILADAECRRVASVVVLCANDPVGAWGAREVLRDRFGLRIDVVSGPTTDNAVGTRYIERQLALRAINARTSGAELGEFIAQRLAERRQVALA